jgi:lipid A ethanolaminephosphotransferase
LNVFSSAARNRASSQPGASSGSFGKRRWSLGVEQLAILASLFFSLTCNHLFFSSALAGRDWSSPKSWLFAAAILVAITAVHAAGLLVVLNRWTAKPLLVILLIVSAAAAYYMDKYTVFFNAEMVRNILKTDVKEASELLSLGMSVHIAVFGILPALLVWRVQLRRTSWKRAIPVRLLYIISAIAIAAGSIMLVFQDFSSLMRNQKEVRFLITPSNYLYSFIRVVAADTESANKAKIQISADARLAPGWAGRHKPMLFILIVGETTRGDNWGLNGYAHQTTPELSKLDVLNFPDAHSCGTNTEVSVPCMFSPYGRRNYDEKAIRAHESFLHIINHVGIKTLWRDNQAGCKGTCDGLEQQRLDSSTDPEFCNDERCLDEIMLKNLGAEVKKAANGNMFIVLHQLGNHGPAYYQRYPESMRTFTPTCDTSDLSKCSREQIVNTFDNAVKYTDHFVAQTIAFLKTQKQYDTAMWYLSDHGESLGENGIYLHGLPYSIAPKEQTHIPMVMWFSDGFLSSFDLNRECLAKKTQTTVSQDNLFHSILGMLQIESQYYDKTFDLSADCRR